MKLIEPSIEILTPIDGEAVLNHIEIAIRNCYKSESSIKEGSAQKIVKTILDSHHYSTIEHFAITFKVTCSRACMAQWTRHRLQSFSIESQRYCAYAKDKFGSEITFIKPTNFDTYSTYAKKLLLDSFQQCEDNYLELINNGMVAQDARQVLNNAVKTDMIVSANLRTLRDFLKLRTDKSAQSEIRFLATTLLTELKSKIPVIFDNIGE